MTYEKTPYAGIRKRDDGKYLVTLEYGEQRVIDPKTGDVKLKRKKTNKVASTLKEARAMREEADQQRRSHDLAMQKNVPFNSSMEEFLEYYRPTLDVSTYERFVSYVRRANKYFDTMDLREIDTLEIEKFFRWCLREDTARDMKPIKSTTVQKIKSMMVKAWNYFVKAKKYGIRGNVIINAEIPDDHTPRFRGTALTEEQVNDLLSASLATQRDYSALVLIGLAVLCGLRRGEIAGLTWKDIEDTGRIHITRQRAAEMRKSGTNNQTWEWKVPKKGDKYGTTPEERKERYAACPNAMYKILDLARRQQREYLGRDIQGSDFVYMEKINMVAGTIPNPDKMSRHFVTVRKQINKYLKAEGKKELPDFRLHDLRHTFASLCLNHEVYALRVAAALGHSNGILPSNIVTFSTYWHDDGDRDEINKCIDSIITVPIEVEKFAGYVKPKENKRKDKKNCEL